MESATDYYPFGMEMPGRTFSSSNYRFGFNGKLKDNEVNGNGNQYDYGFRIYNPRIARFLSVDPIANEYPWYSPYHFAGNKPIECIDLDGAEEYYIINHFFVNSLGNKEIVKVEFVPVPPSIQVPNTKPGDCYIFAEIQYFHPTTKPLDVIVNHKSWLNNVDKATNAANMQQGELNGKTTNLKEKGDAFYIKQKNDEEKGYRGGEQFLELRKRLIWEPDEGDKLPDIENKLHNSPGTKQDLTRICDIAKMFSEYKITISGQASPSIGNYKTNENLGIDRAASLKNVLVSSFQVNSSQISTQGIGIQEATKDNIPENAPAKDQKKYQKTTINLSY
jgi:RHS repeat-associated protein